MVLWFCVGYYQIAALTKSIQESLRSCPGDRGRQAGFTFHTLQL